MELAGRSLESKSRESITRAKPRRDRSGKGGAREKEGEKGGKEGRKAKGVRRAARRYLNTTIYRE